MGNSRMNPNTQNNGQVGTRVTKNGENTAARDIAIHRQITHLSFVKCELELYLDTHPDCKVALDYYHRTVDALKKLYEQHGAMGKPIRAEDSVSDDRWEWVDKPWPWQWERTNDRTREEK